MKLRETHNWLSFSAISNPFSTIKFKFDLSIELAPNSCSNLNISSHEHSENENFATHEVFETDEEKDQDGEETQANRAQ
ncbi:MAG: hypothetical protein ABI675_25465 [Chitinophagaceae bacterium]